MGGKIQVQSVLNDIIKFSSVCWGHIQLLETNFKAKEHSERDVTSDADATNVCEW